MESQGAGLLTHSPAGCAGQTRRWVKFPQPPSQDSGFGSEQFSLQSPSTSCSRSDSYEIRAQLTDAEARARTHAHTQCAHTHILTFKTTLKRLSF